MATDVSLNWLLMGQGPKYLREEFDVERAISMHDDWLDVMKDWYDFEKRPMPDDAVGVRLMGGWNAYPTNSQKADAIRELKTLWDLARLRTDAADDDEKD